MLAVDDAAARPSGAKVASDALGADIDGNVFAIHFGADRLADQAPRNAIK